MAVIVPNYILWMSPFSRDRPGQIVFSPGRSTAQRYQASEGLRWHELATSADYAVSSVSQGQPIFREYKNRRGHGLHQNVLVSYLMKLMPGQVIIEETPDHEDDRLIFTLAGWRLMQMIGDPL